MIAIVDYRAGNLTSVARAMEDLDIPCKVTANPDEILNAERVVFPGVGAAGKAMEMLRETGLDQVIRKVFENGVPLLGICLGTQIVLERSEENDTTCLGILKGATRGFASEFAQLKDKALKIPHMGWNQVRFLRMHPVFKDISETSDFYFVHSYFPDPADRELRIGVTDYGVTFASVLACRNLVATQFHPEKSGPVGLAILKNFSKWDGRSG
ncbi:MAG: imidazole glycerol phosphate synthase subunit HisH [Deltaproteobacteria bacterium]|nr:imidazole glycerol phosphate synthase subunit HisH [Deltaproteobacteria bacterium]